MGTLTVGMFGTLDGVVQAPGGPDEDREGGFPHGGWQMPFFEDEWVQDVIQGIERMDAMVLGRKTYDIFAGYWPDQPADDPIASRFNAVPKYVASRTQSGLSWNNASVVGGDLAEAIRKVKQEHDEVRTFGSADLVQSLMRLGLVDRFELYLFPVVLGTGKRLFPEGVDPARFRLVESRTFDGGAILLTYEPAGKPTYGNPAGQEPQDAREEPPVARQEAA